MRYLTSFQNNLQLGRFWTICALPGIFRTRHHSMPVLLVVCVMYMKLCVGTYLFVWLRIQSFRTAYQL